MSRFRVQILLAAGVIENFYPFEALGVIPNYDPPLRTTRTYLRIDSSAKSTLMAEKLRFHCVVSRYRDSSFAVV